MKNNVRKILGDIDIFKKEIDNYEIEIHYSIQDNCKVAFDIVWSLPNSDYYYYDQLQISF